jgi:hypothetical protein
MSQLNIADLLPPAESLINGKTESEIVELQVWLCIEKLILEERSTLNIVLHPDFREAKKRLVDAVGMKRADEVMNDIFSNLEA